MFSVTSCSRLPKGLSLPDQGGEIPLLTQSDRINELPGDIVIPSFSAGRDAVVDLTVVSSQQNLLVACVGAEPGSALAHRFEQKMTKSFDACERAGYKFIPACVEVLGDWHSVAEDLIKRLGNALAITVGREEEEITRFPFQRPSFVAQDVDGDLEGDREHLD